MYICILHSNTDSCQAVKSVYPANLLKQHHHQFSDFEHFAPFHEREIKIEFSNSNSNLSRDVRMQRTLTHKMTLFSGSVAAVVCQNGFFKFLSISLNSLQRSWFTLFTLDVDTTDFYRLEVLPRSTTHPHDTPTEQQGDPVSNKMMINLSRQCSIIWWSKISMEITNSSVNLYFFTQPYDQKVNWWLIQIQCFKTILWLQA
jgi:hypothetical protein